MRFDSRRLHQKYAHKSLILWILWLHGFRLYPLLYTQMGKSRPDRGMFRRGNRWYLRVYLRGRGRKIIALKPAGSSHATRSKEVAIVLAQRIRRQIRDDHLPNDNKPISTLVDEFAHEAVLDGMPKHARRAAVMVRRLAKQQGLTGPAEITPAKIQTYLADLCAAGRAPSTVWNHRAAISGFCQFLKRRGLLYSNPALGTKVATIQRAVPIFLTEPQADQALELARSHGIYAEVATAIYTGLRRGELRRMQWRHVDYARKVLIVPPAPYVRSSRSKSRKPRAVPLSRKAIAVLEAHQKITGQRRYVFPGRLRKGHSGMRREGWWAEALKPLQKAIPAFTERPGKRVGRGWHLLRHTFASWLIQRGVSIYKLKDWLGHRDIRTTEIYSHLMPQYDEDIERI